MTRTSPALLLALLLSLLGAGVATGAGPVGMQVPGGAVVAEARLTSLEPAVVTTEALTLRGTIRNVSDARIVDPLPALRWSLDALQTPDELDLVEQNPLFRYGGVDYRYSVSLPSLEPGEQATFAIEVPLADLVPGPGVYVVGFDTLATLPDGLRVFVASARTTVAVDVTREEPLAASLLWPLASAPSLLPDGRLVDDTLAAEIAPGGRLDALVRAATGAPVTWVVDPDLVDTVAAMVPGYETARPPGPGTGGADAAGFLALLSSAVSVDSDVRRLPAADPDLGGMAASGFEPPEVAATAEAALRSSVLTDLLGRRIPPLALLTDRPVDEALLATYAEAGLEDAVLPASSVVGGPGTVAPLAGTTVTAVRAQPLPPPASDPTVGPALALRQRLLAETALAGEASALVLAPDPRWSVTAPEASAVVAAWQQAPWVRPVALDELPVAPEPVTLREDEAAEPLETSIAEGLRQVAVDLDRLRPLFAEPPVDDDERPVVSARVVSTAWRAQPDRGADYVGAVRDVVAGAASQVGLVLSETITLSSRSGRFPVTLVNDSAADVVVGVRFTSQNSSRLRVEDIAPTVLTAGEKRTFTATALATANGRVVVTAELVTTEGTTVGATTSTVVDVTNVGSLGWVVVATGGVLLAVAIGRSRWRRRRSPPAAARTPPLGVDVEDRVG